MAHYKNITRTASVRQAVKYWWNVVKNYDGKEIKEKTYTTKLINDTPSYTNQAGTLECFTLVKGALNCDGIDVAPGSTILLWPGEQLHTQGVELAFVSKMRED